MLLTGVVVASIAIVAAAKVAAAGGRSGTYRYWCDRMREPVPPDAVGLVALGDSTVQAIGAERPLDGYVGRVADYLASKLDGEPSTGSFAFLPKQQP